ncbi:MAG TPA: hypothetical protein VFZ61_23320 [Polyangiales bacterium]
MSKLSPDRPRKLARTATALALALGLSLGLPSALAAPTCLKEENPCDPQKLCTFKGQLAEKVFLYQTYLRNSQKRSGRKQGIRYNGVLYDASVAEAQKSFPTASEAELAVKAGQIFQAKVRKFAADKFKEPACKDGAMPNKTLLPKPGYGGMYTDERCNVYANYDSGEYDSESFGSTDTTSCKEFYDRDRAHEAIHRKTCLAAKDAEKSLDAIDDMIEDEIKAYEHSVRLSAAYVKMLNIQCSAKKKPSELQARAKRIRDLLAPYEKKGG